MKFLNFSKLTLAILSTSGAFLVFWGVAVEMGFALFLGLVCLFPFLWKLVLHMIYQAVYAVKSASKDAEKKDDA